MYSVGDMNITTPDTCIAQWESELILTADQTHIPPEERSRILHEIDVLYNEIHDVLSLMQSA